MGVNINSNNRGTDNASSANENTPFEAPKVNTAPQSNVDYFGFGGDTFGFIPMKEGSEYTNKIAKAIEDIYKKTSKPIPGVEPFVLVLDNTVATRMVYSILAIVNRVSELKFHYHYIILEATGTQPFTAKEISDKLNNARREYNNSRVMVDVYVPGDANDNDLHMLIGSALKKKLNITGEIELVSLDGMVLHKDVEITDDLCRKISIISYNALWGEHLAENGESYANINIAKVKEISNKSGTPIKGMAFVNETSNTKTALDPLGSPIRADFKLVLETRFANNNIGSINSRGSQVPLTKIMGFVNPIPVELPRDIVTAYGPQKTFIKKFIPNIVVTSIATYMPTLEYMLLGLTSAVVQANINQWPSSLNMDTTGALNMFTDLTGVVSSGKAVVGERMNFSKQAFDKSFKLIREMFAEEETTISCDVQASGPETFYTSVLAVAAAPATDRISASNKEKASQSIISAAHQLTNGAFPMNFPIDNIFVGPAVLVPTGTWEDKTGTRDIRDIDYAWIAAHTDDTTLLQQWALTSTPSNTSGLDPFLTRIEIISKFIDTARITGKAARVTFTKAFIDALTSACRAAGLDATYTPLITLSENTNIQVIGNYFANAGIGGNYQFASMSGPQGVNIYTPYTYFQYQ